MKRHHFLLLAIFTGLAAFLPERAMAQPLILAEPNTKSAFVGDGNVTLQVLATGTTTLSYQWQQKVSSGNFSDITNNTTFAGVTTAALTINFTDTTLNGSKYRCVVTETAGSTTSLGAKLNVYNAPSVTPNVTITGTGVDGGGNATIAANSTANITISVTGLNPGDTVRIQRSLDLNGNGKADPGEPIAQSFVVTDGQVTKFGGITDPDIPGDEDGAADGNITTHISLPTSPEVGRNAGTYLIKVASPTGEFKTVTKTLVVTQPTYGQTVSGQVSNGVSTVPYAPVIFLSSNGNNQNYVAGVVADANGNYTLQLPTGTYTVISTAAGYVQPFATANQVTVSSGGNQTGVDVSITPATCTITAPGNDTVDSPLHGAQYFIQSQSAFNEGAVALAFTDSDSNLIAALTSANDWDLQLSQYSAHALGYLQPQNDLTENTTTGNLTIGTIELTSANAMIYGVVKDNENNLLGGVNVEDNDSNYQDDAITYGNGSYYLLANGPFSVPPDDWNVNLDNSNSVLANYLSPQNYNVQVQSGPAYPANFVLQSSAASLQGTVKENGNAVPGIQIDLFYNGQFENSAIADNSGNFSFGVANGNWSLALDSGFNNVSYNVLGPTLTENVTGNNSITGIAFPVVATTGVISGSVQNGNSSGSVAASTTVNGVVYNQSANLQSTGNYDIQVFNGTWTLTVTGNNGSTYNSQNVTVNGSATANFTASNSPPPIGSPLVLAGATNKNAFVGDANVTFQVLATSNISLTYQWQSKVGNTSYSNLTDGGNISGSATPTLTINSPQLSMNGTILRCVVSNTVGSVKSLSGNLYVYPTPTVVPSLNVTPSSFAANTTGNIDLQVGNLTPGDTVRVQIFQDANTNGKIDPGEPLVESFLVTDGNVTQIGGVTDADIPGDDDGAADGNISTHIHAPQGGFTAGNYIVKIGSTKGDFRSVSQEITITQPILGQTVSGQVTSNGTPVPYAGIILLNTNGDNYNFAGGMSADANGNYTLQASPGSYAVYAAAPGYVLNQADAPMITITSGQNQTAANISLTAATCTISTTVEDALGNPTLPGLKYVLQSDNNGQFGLSYTDTGGNLIAAVTQASDWDLQVSAADAHLHGYVQPVADLVFDTTAGDLKPAPIYLTEANALITGQVEDTLGNSLAGVSVDDNDSNNNQDQAITDANGNYFLLANGPNSGLADNWSVYLDSNNPTLVGYTLPSSQSVDLFAGQNSSVNFTAESPPTPLGFPLVLAGATSQTAFVGDATATFQVLAASNTTLTYQWQTNAGGTISNITNNGSFAGATTATLTITNPTLALNGTGYRCIVTNSNGSVNSLGAELKVYNAPSVTPNLTVTPGTIAANSTGNVDFQVTGLSTGDTVRVDVYADSNANGQIELGEPLVQSFYVTDGQANQFGGVTDPDLYGDDDGVADGNITTHINLTNSAVGGQLAGSYIVKIFSPTGEFKTLTKTLTVTQPNYGQTISGQVTSGGTPVPYAAVLLLTTSHDKGLVGGVHADANGNYSLEAPVGSYIMYALATGYVLSNSDAPNITVASSQNQTGVNVNLTPATCTIATSVTDASDNNSLAGMEISLKSSNNNQFGIAYSDSDGNLIAAVTAASDWQLNVSSGGLHALGYLQPQNKTSADTSSGSVALSSIQLDPGNALIYGTVEDGLGNPLAGVNMDANDNNTGNDDYATTSANGTYYLLANGPEGGSAESWYVNPDSNNPVLANYVTPQGQNVDVSPGQSYQTNFTAEVATAHLQGTVTNNGSPASGIQLDLFSVSGGNNNFVSSITTNGTGSFDFPVTNGNWSLALDTYNLQQENVVGPNLSENVTGNQTISGIDYEVVTATGNISGSVDDGDTGGSAYASANIGGVLYNTGSQIDSNGDFSFPVINGTWDVSVNSNNGQNYNTQNITVNGSAVANFTQPNTGGGNPNSTYLNGTVTLNGNPVANVTINAYDQNNNNVNTVTASDGTFSLQVTAGNWVLSPSSNDPNVILPQPGGGSTSGNTGPEDPALFFTVTAGVNINNIAIVALTPTSHITGTVLDQNNHPLPATLSITATTVVNGVPYLVNGSTDNTGNYSLGAVDGSWLVYITSAGFVIPNAQTVAINGSDMTANFTIDVTAYLQGTVTDSNSQPVAGLAIGAFDESGDSLQTTSASDGTFSLGVIGGNWTFYFPNGSGPNIILPSSQISYTVTDGTNITGIAIPVLSSNEQITGTVFDSNNQPIATNSTSVTANITINGFDYNVYGETDNTGNYSIGVTNGTWSVDVFPQGYLTPAAQNITVNGSNQVANFTTPATTHLRGTVTDNNSNPVSGVTISAYGDDNGDNVYTTTGADGTFDLGVIGGNWSVSASSSDATLITPSSFITYTLTDGVDLNGISIEVLEVAAQITGTVLDANNQPISGAVLTANITINSTEYNVYGSTDNNGAYSLGVANGTWVVSGYVSTPVGHNLAPQNIVVNGADQVANFSAITAHLIGTATLNGEPLAGVIVNAYDQNNDQAQATSASDGTFSVPVFGGTWTLAFTSNDPNLIFPNLSNSYFVSDGTDITGIALPLLEAAEQISGTVLYSNNQPIADAEVMANTTINDVDYSVITYTDGNGNYTLPLANGTWEVSIITKANLNLNPQSIVVNGINQVVNFTEQVANFAESATAYLDGEVTLNSTPVSGVTIHGYDDNGDYDFTNSAADGTFGLGVIGGNWTTYFSSSNTSLILPTFLGPYAVTDGTNITNITVAALAATEQISGNVRDFFNGADSVGAQVVATTTINGVNYSVTGYTDGTGHYSLGVADGTWLVSVYGSGFNPPAQSVVLSGASQIANFSVNADAFLLGQVTLNGNPLSGVFIRGYSDNGDFDNVTSVNDGTFVLGVVDGNWSLTFSGGGPNIILPTGLGPYGVTGSANITEVDVPALQASEQISGTVFGFNGQASVGAQVTATATINGFNYSVVSYTDATGHYTLGVANGTWEVSVTGAGFNPAPQSVAVNDANAVANFTETATAYLDGTVTENDNPVDGVTIHGYDNNGDFDDTTSAFDGNNDGAFSLGVVGGNWTLYFSSDDNTLILPTSFGPYDVTDGTNISSIVIPVLPANEQISGTVLDLNGQPSIGAEVTANTSINGIPYSVTDYTDENGQYALGVANGTWQINVTGAGFNPSPANVVVDGADEVVIFTAVPPYSNPNLTAVLLNDANLTHPAQLATDGTTLYVSGGAADSSQDIFSVPVAGGAATILHPAFNPQQLALIGNKVDWIDPNSGPVTDTQILSASTTSGGPTNEIYTGSDVGQPIVDGSGLASDGTTLYAADEVDGTVWSLNPDGSNLTELGGARYSGYFSTEHFNSIAVDQGVVYVADSGDASASLAPEVDSIAANGNGSSSFTKIFCGAPLVRPVGIAAGAGYIYVADVGANNTIWQIPESGGTPVALLPGAPFISVSGLAYANGYLYIADSGAGVIYKLSLPTVAPSITAQPQNNAVATNGNATFTIASSGAPEPAIQWQVSTDGGSTWSNLTNGNYISGATGATLTVETPDLTLSGAQYRAVASSRAGPPIISNPATLVVGFSSNYLSWLNSNFSSQQLFNPAISGLTATPAGDGITNLAKYALGLPPLTNDQNLLPQPTASNNFLSLSFSAAQTDVVYTVEVSNDLVSWDSNAASIQMNGSTETASYPISTQSDPNTQGLVFMRVIISLPPGHRNIVAPTLVP